MIIDIRQRTLEKLALLFYYKRLKRNQNGNAVSDWQRAERFLNYCEKRTELVWKIMK